MSLRSSAGEQRAIKAASKDTFEKSGSKGRKQRRDGSCGQVGSRAWFLVNIRAQWADAERGGRGAELCGQRAGSPSAQEGAWVWTGAQQAEGRAGGRCLQVRTASPDLSRFLSEGGRNR